jgi:glycosyltransferase involved in cell wall biosynthesis
MFSVLLPSRNRLDLLKHAVASVVRQRFTDFEIVVSDNASTSDYAAYVESLGDSRVRLIRSEVALPVTQNWRRALEASLGRYIIMLGDDDALAPGCLDHAAELIAHTPDLDVVYGMAYHYAYPGVLPNAADGFLATIRPRPIYDGSATPYMLDTGKARHFGRMALGFRHLFAFNSQFFIWSRAFIDRMARFGPFFQSPYPDFYSSFMTMLQADRILVTPEPGVLIGISPQSFGFYFHNDQLAAGGEMLNLTPDDAEEMRSLSPAAS